MFKNIISKTSMLTVTAAAMLAPVAAQSANLPGAAGSSSDPCVIRDKAFVFNNCSGVVKKATIPVPLTSYKNYSVKARVRGNDLEPTSCKGVRWDNSNNDWASTLEGATSSAEYVSISLGTINVPSGSLTFECNLAARNSAPLYGSVHSVDWN